MTSRLSKLSAQYKLNQADTLCQSMEAERVLLTAQRSPVCCDAQQQQGQMMGSRCWSHVRFSARGCLVYLGRTTQDLGFALLLQSIIPFICGKQNTNTLVIPRLVSHYGLTFRLLSSPEGLWGPIILRYSSFESLCSDFPSRSAAWSLQAASCAYSCLWMIESTEEQRSSDGSREPHTAREALGHRSLGSDVAPTT